jgi:hypothetical protein
MSKNIPITQRVSQGLFKSKVSEPILNVGQAGVSGNNITKGDALPAKSTTSPLKQMANPASQKSNSEEGKTYESGGKIVKVTKSQSAGSLIKGKETVVPGQKYVANETPAWRKKYNTPEKVAAYNTAKKAQIANDPKYQSKVVKEPDTQSAGTEDVNVSEATLYTKDKGDAQTALDRRGNVRNIKNLTGQEKRNDMRTLRSGGFKDDKGAVIEKGTEAFKNKKAEIKQNKRNTRSEFIKSEIENSKNQSAQNLKASLAGGYSTKDVVGKEREISAGDKTIDVQRKDFENKAAAEALLSKTKKADAAKSFSDASKAFDNTSVSGKDPISSAGSLGTTAPKEPIKKPVAEADPTDVPTIGKKYTNGFFNKKSPLKMKYFK